jgi:glutathione S-transferase
MALAHKGLKAETIPWRCTEREAIAFSGSRTVPVLVHNQHPRVIERQAIRLSVAGSSPTGRLSLFGAASSVPLAEFIDTWADAALLPSLARTVLMDIHRHIHERGRDYFRSSREKPLVKSLEDVVADRPATSRH